MTKIISFIEPKGMNQHIYCFLQYQILNAQERINYSEYCYHVKQYSVISEIILFSYTMHYTFHCELLHCNFQISLSFLLIALESRYCPFKDSSLFCKRSIIDQLILLAATTENKKLAT